jgi:hypothetical protein
MVKITSLPDTNWKAQNRENKTWILQGIYKAMEGRNLKKKGTAIINSYEI